MSINAMTEYKGYSAEDKAALAELKTHVAKQLGVEETAVKTTDLIAALTPGMETPAHLKGI